jgi:hypothetical protein
MSLAPLQSPFERNNILTTAMNWRSTWVSDAQYLQNDVVVSPSNNGTYICKLTSLKSNIDPSTDAAWEEVSATSTGVIALIGGAGISVDSTDPQQPIINNEGVLTIAQGTGITVDNTDPRNPVVATTAIASITAGNSGIFIDNSVPNIPAIYNTGVIQITGVDITVGGSQQNPVLVNDGVIKLIGSAGIGVDTPSGIVTISNTGVCTLTNGDGISTTGGPNPTIANTGVITVTAADPSITVDNTDPQNPKISSTVPRLTSLYPASSFIGLQSMPVNYTGSLNFAQPATPTFLTTTVASGGIPGHPNAAFLFDFSAILLYFQDSVGLAAGNTITIKFHDSVNNVVYSPAVYPNTLNLVASAVSGATPPYPIPLCSGFYDIAEAYAAGIRVITQIFIQNNTTSRMTCLYSGSIYATYYPNGIE